MGDGQWLEGGVSVGGPVVGVSMQQVMLGGVGGDQAVGAQESVAGGEDLGVGRGEERGGIGAKISANRPRGGIVIRGEDGGTKLGGVYIHSAEADAGDM